MNGELSLRLVLMVSLVIATQIGGSALLVKTDGFREPAWTAACLATYAISFYLLADSIRRGLALSLVMPILAALVPLGAIAVAVIVFHEQASLGRIGLLGAACALIGVAATL